MATIHKCDGCGILSPDENNLNISNDWFEVEVKNRADRLELFRENFLLCRECMELGNPVSGLAKLWQNISRYFN